MRDHGTDRDEESVCGLQTTREAFQTLDFQKVKAVRWPISCSHLKILPDCPENILTLALHITNDWQQARAPCTWTLERCVSGEWRSDLPSGYNKHIDVVGRSRVAAVLLVRPAVSQEPSRTARTSPSWFTQACKHICCGWNNGAARTQTGLLLFDL